MKPGSVILRARAFSLALVFGATSLITLMTPGIAHAVVHDCLFTGATDVFFSKAGNWSNCGGVAPQTGDNLVFDNTGLSSWYQASNDIVGLSVGSITFSGTNTTSNYLISDNTITISNGIIDTTVPGGGPAIDADIALSGSQTFSTDNAVEINSDNVYLSSNTLTLNGTGGSFRFTGAIHSTGGAIVNNNTGWVYLDGDNSLFSGNITLNSGMLSAISQNALGDGSGTLTVNDGATWAVDLSANTAVAEDIVLNGNGTTGEDGAVSVGYYGGEFKLTLSGHVTLGSDSLYTGADDTNITGTYTSNSHNLSVLGGNQGTVTLPSGNVLSAPAQTFTVDSSDSQPATDITISRNQTYAIDGTRGDVTVANGGILKGSGTVGALVVDSGGVVAPGHSPGCMSSGNLTLNGAYQAEIGGTTACTGYDQLNVTGTVDITGSTLTTNLYNSYKPKAGESYTIIKNDGSDAVTGNFTGLPEGATFNVGGYVLQITYRGGDGNDVVLSVKTVPATPDTGFALIGANPLTTLVGTVLAAGVLVIFARYRQVTQKVLVRRSK